MISADQLVVEFKNMGSKKIRALNEFSVKIHQGDFFALLGPNGAGKSTAMYCFLGLLKPQSGRLSVFGEVPSLGSPAYKKIGYLPEEPHYHSYLTVEELLVYYGSLYGMKVQPGDLKTTLDRFDLLDYRNLRMDKCSKGIKQKVGLAQCLIGNPELLFLDEPTRGLDPFAVKEIRDIMVNLHKNGTTIVMNSHVLSEVELVANHVAIINQGRLIKQDKLKNLLKTKKDQYQVEFGRTKTVPPYVDGVKKEGRKTIGTIPVNKLTVFMSFLKKNNSKLIHCALTKTSLEDSLFKYLRGD